MPMIVSGRAASRLSRAQAGGAVTAHARPAGLDTGEFLLSAAVVSNSEIHKDIYKLTDDSTRCKAPELPVKPARVSSGQDAVDPVAKIALDIPTLCKHGLYDGCNVQVSNPARPDIPPHTVTLLARPGVAQISHHETGHHDTVATTDMRQGHACIPPLLAFNLGLEYELAPFLGRASLQSETETQHRAADGSLVGSIKVRQQPLHLAVADIQAAHCRQQVAEALWLAKIRSPAVGPHEGEVAASKDSENDSADGEQLARQETKEETEALLTVRQGLQTYFRRQPRLLAQGDTVVVSTADMSGSLAFVDVLSLPDMPLAASLGQHSVTYFKVVDILPKTSMTVDATKTRIELKGTCAGRFPVGAARAHSAANACIHKDGRPDGAMSGGSLGMHHLAAFQEHAHMAGVGTLLPAWRRIAQLFAPLCHQQGTLSDLRTALLLNGPKGSGKSTAVQAAAAALGLHVVPFNCHELKAQDGSAAVGALKAAFDSAQEYAPSVLLLEEFHALSGGPFEAGGQAGGAPAASIRLASQLSTCIEEASSAPAAASDKDEQAGSATASRVFLVACCHRAEDIPAPLRRCFTHEMVLEAPDQDARQKLLEGNCQARHASGMLHNVAVQTAGLLPGDLSAITADAAACAALRHVILPDVLSKELDLPSSIHEGTQTNGAISDPHRSENGLAINETHYEDALSEVRQRTAVSIGAPEVPDVRWEDVGGLEDVKAAILDTVELPLRHPHLFAQGLRRRSGVLLYGPPGTGKTLLAKAVATQCSLNFLSVKGPELINMYIGESERQVREVFARARRARPCVLFFDELDSLAPARGAGADSGGVMDRVVAQLLSEIDGVQDSRSSAPGTTAGTDSQDIFVIGATNRPDLLDRALLRPGRLDKLLYVGVAEDEASKLKVLQALTRKFSLSDQVDLGAVARECAPTFTGADLYALCADAWMAALKRTMAEVEDPAVHEDNPQEVFVDQCDFWTALRELRPSLSADELARYQQMRMQFAAA